MIGTNEQFENILNILKNNAKNYEDKRIKYIGYCDAIDGLFIDNRYGWSKVEFYNELNRRLGIQTNDLARSERENKKKAELKTKKMKPILKSKKGSKIEPPF